MYQRNDLILSGILRGEGGPFYGERWPSFNGEGWYTSRGRNWYTLSYHLQQSFAEEEYYNFLQDQEEVIDNILSEIPEGLSRYEQIRCFNTYLTRNNSFNSSADEPIESHYAITALQGNTGENGPVCEAYAKAFKILCDARGIPCEYIIGMAGWYGNVDGHGWNAVQMEDGKWYIVDVTWNDPSGGDNTTGVSGQETEDYLLIGSDTAVNGVLFKDSHTAHEYTSTYFSFTNYPTLSKTAYIACSSQATLGDMNLDGEVDAEDLTLLARHVAKIELVEGAALTNSDVDGDGDVDAEDLTVHARYVAKIITQWPAA